MTRRLPNDAEVLAALRREVTQAWYGWAPNWVSLTALHAAVAIAGFPRGAATEAGLRRSLDRLIAAGSVRRCDVEGPDGTPEADWFVPV